MDFRVYTAIGFFTDNLSSNLSLTEVAEYVKLSPWHLDRLFKAETGIPFKQYVIQLGMEMSAELLRSSSLSVKEIMSRLGIQDRSHFTRDFKKKYGKSPKAYREGH